MTHPERRDPAGGSDDPSATSRSDAADPSAWQIIAGIECVALMISLVMPITPSRTGSNRSAAELITPDPSYAFEVAFWFILSNLLLAALAVAFVVYQRWTRGDGEPGG